MLFKESNRTLNTLAQNKIQILMTNIRKIIYWYRYRVASLRMAFNYYLHKHKRLFIKILANLFATEFPEKKNMSLLVLQFDLVWLKI